MQLVRIECRVPEYGWTTQKVFHFLNFLVNGGLYPLIHVIHKQRMRYFSLLMVDTAVILVLCSPIGCFCISSECPADKAWGLMNLNYVLVPEHLNQIFPSYYYNVVAFQIFQHVLLDLPGLAFFTTYALLVLFWAEIYYQVGYYSIWLTILAHFDYHGFFLVSFCLKWFWIHAQFLFLNWNAFRHVLCRLMGLGQLSIQLMEWFTLYR